ncbi:hypothetical protein [Demetria terragena]|uniref:hypothetical protein n=1 Tax=Demetria terragena TaxID=63959 RepID=UPI00037AE986|nr:hypothetical protein [Demetria terragena]
MVGWADAEVVGAEVGDDGREVAVGAAVFDGAAVEVAVVGGGAVVAGAELVGTATARGLLG